jgi:hypothetical protein
MTPERRAQLHKQLVKGWKPKMSVEINVEDLRELLDAADALDLAVTKITELEDAAHKLGVHPGEVE